MESESNRLNNTDEEEDKETSVDTPELVIKLRVLLGEKYPELRLPPNSDYILERCLRHRKFHVNQAANQVHSFFKLLHELSKLKSENILKPSIHQTYFFDSFSFGLLKQKDGTGATILYDNYETMPGETFNATNILAVFFVVIHELLQQSSDIKKLEVVFIANLKGFGFAHAKQFTFSLIKTCSKIVQGALPVSFKAFHCINVPSVFFYTYAMFKPFLRQKIKDRMHLHGNDLTEFYRVFDKSLLPTALEGDLPNKEAVDTDFVESLCKKDFHYAELLRYGYGAPEEIQS